LRDRNDFSSSRRRVSSSTTRMCGLSDDASMLR
jgi:hypothetical protein